MTTITRYRWFWRDDRVSRRPIRVCCALVVVLAWACLASAQVTSAVLQGVVTDGQGGVLPGVTRHCHQYRDRARARGCLRPRRLLPATALPPGPYPSRATMDGFTPYTRTGLVLTVGQTATINIQLGSVTLTEAVTVEATAPLVDTASNALGTTVTNAQLDDLPLAGRDFASLARLAPGVTGVGGGGITAGGQLTRNNSVVVDGTSNDEQGIAGTRGSFSLESVREYVDLYEPVRGRARPGRQARWSTSSPDRGPTSSRGGLFAFHRDDSLDAQNPFSKAQGSGTAPFSEQRGGGFLGGPFIKNTWHYFGSYELQRNETTNVVTSTLVPVDQREFPEDGSRDQYFFKTDYQLPRNNRLERPLPLRPEHDDGRRHRRPEPVRARERSEDQILATRGVADVVAVVAHRERGPGAVWHALDLLDRRSATPTRMA